MPSRRIDAWGRVWFDGADAVELLMAGADITQLLIDPDSMIDAYNRLCEHRNKAAYRVPPVSDPEQTPDQMTTRRINTWLVPPEYQQIDIRQILLQRCQRADEIKRVNHEMDMFETRGLLPVLRLMLHLVDHWRAHGVVWGVGRGSSVASYCLFLLGVHKIDSLAFDLPIEEFLRC